MDPIERALRATWRALGGEPTPGSLAAMLERRGYRRIQLQALATGHSVVDVHLNGADARFVVDTGAGATVVHGAWALAAGFGEGATQEDATGLGGTQTASLHAVDDLRIGDFDADVREVMVLDLSDVIDALSDKCGVQVHGVVGQDVLQRHRAVLTMEDAAMYLAA